MFYVFNTRSGRYVSADYASALAGRDVPQPFPTREAAEREADRLDYFGDGHFSVHTSVMDEALVSYE